MENSELFRISSDRKIIIKKPRILSHINIKEIQLRNDQKNFLHSGSRSFNSRQRYLTSRKVKKNDLRGQISLLSDLISNYSSSSIKNLLLIQKLKDENDFLLEELNRNIKKNTLFNKTTKEIFSDIVGEYEKRKYKIPNLTLENNLFKKTPLLIETKNDVDEFYKTDKNTQGNFILDMDEFPEKNWVFLKKLKREVNSKGEKNLFNNSEWAKMNKTQDYYMNKKILAEQKERKKLKNDINNIKILIEKQEKEKNNIEDYYSSRTSRNNIIPKKIKYLPLDIKNLIKGKLIKTNRKKNIYSLKILNSESYKNSDILRMKNKKFNKTIKGFFKNNKIFGKTLITSLEKNPKNKNNNKKIYSYTEQIYNKINKKKLTDFDSVENDIIQYLKKNNYKITNMNLDNFNKDFSERIYDIKAKVRKQNLSNNIQKHLSDYGRNGYNELKKIQNTEKVIEKMDKYLAKHIIDKYFED